MEADLNSNVHCYWPHYHTKRLTKFSISRNKILMMYGIQTKKIPKVRECLSTSFLGRTIFSSVKWCFIYFSYTTNLNKLLLYKRTESVERWRENKTIIWLRSGKRKCVIFKMKQKRNKKWRRRRNEEMKKKQNWCVCWLQDKQQSFRQFKIQSHCHTAEMAVWMKRVLLHDEAVERQRAN